MVYIGCSKTECGRFAPQTRPISFAICSRAEFDRYARFNSWGSARETFDWDEMCDVKIPIPDIHVQRAIAEMYSVYIQRKDINERMKVQIKGLCPILIKGAMEEASA